ncbi:MAG: phage holin family protein [Gammaproteobacteria bacterium]|nr:phage holin family protein [Gammaproteobacteria bacterium]MBU1833165.1 phage holin family protein [Gammaproteobacteria bacterium]
MGDHAQQIVKPIADAMTYAGSAATVISGLTINEWGVIIGAVVAIAGLAVSTAINVWFKRQQLEIMRTQLKTPPED